MRAGPHPASEVPGRVSRHSLLTLASLAGGCLLTYCLFLPLQGHLGLNLISFFEPYFRGVIYLRVLQFVVVFVSSYLLLPFFLYLGYRLSLALLSRIARRLSRDRTGPGQPAAPGSRPAATAVTVRAAGTSRDAPPALTDGGEDSRPHGGSPDREAATFGRKSGSDPRPGVAQDPEAVGDSAPSGADGVPARPPARDAVPDPGAGEGGRRPTRLAGVRNSLTSGFATAGEVLTQFAAEISAALPRRARRFLGSGRAVARRAGRPLLRAGRYAYLAVCLLFLSLETLLFLYLIGQGAMHANGALAFYAECGNCHYRLRPFNYNLTAGLWDVTVDRMIRHAAAIGRPFPVEKRGEIVAFLRAVRSYSDRQLRFSKCYVCHLPSRVFHARRTGREWALAIDRIHRQNLFHISGPQAEQLTRHLGGNREWALPAPDPGSPAAAALDRKLDFEGRCAVCHTLDIIRQPYIRTDEWQDILVRMGKKEPDLISADEALSFLPLVRDCLSLGNEDFVSRFPHSTMREKRDAPPDRF